MYMCVIVYAYDRMSMDLRVYVHVPGSVPGSAHVHVHVDASIYIYISHFRIYIQTCRCKYICICLFMLVYIHITYMCAFLCMSFVCMYVYITLLWTRVSMINA